MWHGEERKQDIHHSKTQRFSSLAEMCVLKLGKWNILFQRGAEGPEGARTSFQIDTLTSNNDISAKSYKPFNVSI